jgi:hypothetical protein
VETGSAPQVGTSPGQVDQRVPIITPDLTQTIRATAAAVPIVALLLPPTGYLVRWIALMFAPWAPQELAGAAELGDLAATGFWSLVVGAGGALLYFGFQVVLSPGRSYFWPVDMIRDFWREFGLTPTRARRARRFHDSAIARSDRENLALLGRWARHRWRAMTPRRRWPLPVLALLRVLLLVVSAAGALVALNYIRSVTIGDPIGISIALTAGFLSQWRLSVLARAYPEGIPWTRTVPLVLVLLFAAAIGAGLSGNIAPRPARYDFAIDVGLSDGPFQQLGTASGLQFLVSCSDPIHRVLGVPLSQITAYSFDPAFKPEIDPSLQAVILEGADWHLGFQPCE